MEAKIRPRVIIEAVIIRADGTKEDLGVIADSREGTVQIEKKVEDNG